jgi:hypothetical protein
MQKRVKQVQVVGSSFIRRRGSNNQSTIQNPTRIFENEKSQEYTLNNVNTLNIVNCK